MSRAPIAFTLVSLILAVALVPGVLRGEVLSQANLLTEYYPWKAHAAAGGNAPNPLLFDPPFLFYPLLVHAVESVHRGELPVWSTGLYAGHPFLAAFQTALFSPFTAIAYIVPLPYATVPMALAPLVVGGLGMFRFVRSLGLNAPAAWFAGIGYLLNGFSVMWMEHPLAPVACWLPWILHAIDRLREAPRPRRAAALAVFVALSIVAGHPETTTKVLGFAGAYALAGLLVERSGGWLALAWGAAAGALLTAIQVVPFVEYLLQSEALLSRDGAAVNRFFMPVSTAVAALVPDFLGNPGRGAYLTVTNRFGFPANYAEQAIYAGVAALVLAAAGLISAAATWRVRFLAAAATVSAALMYGTPGLLHGVSALPMLRVMILARFGLIVIVSVLIVAAYGVHHVTGTTQRMPARLRTRTALAAALIVTAILGMYVWWLPALRAQGLAAATLAACTTAAIVVTLATIVVWLRASDSLSPGVAAIGLCALLAVDLLAAGRGVHQTVPASAVYPRLAEIELIRRDPDPGRVYGWGTTLVPNAALAYGLQDARGWDGMNPARYVRLLDLGYLRQASDGARRLREPQILDLLNVKYVLTPPDVALQPPRFVRMDGGGAPVYVNTRALPRAFLVDRVQVMDDEGLRRTLYEGTTDLSRVALLETPADPGVEPEAAASEAARGTARIREYRDRFVAIDVESAGRRLLVLGDAYYPGWTAAVDGRPQTILRANFALRAVQVPAGRHTVTFEYRPWSLRLGGWISAATIALLALAAALDRTRA